MSAQTKPPADALAVRKQELLRRSASLRQQGMAMMSQALGPSLGLADRAVASVRSVRRHPWLFLLAALLGGMGLGVAVQRPRGLGTVVRRGVLAWRWWQRVQPLVAPLVAWMAARGLSESDESARPPPDEVTSSAPESIR